MIGTSADLRKPLQRAFLDSESLGNLVWNEGIA